MHTSFRGVRLLLALPLLLVFSACDSVVSPHTEAGLTSAVRPDAEGSQAAILKAVRQATARFNSTTQATKAGYASFGHCVAHPEFGGMGYHWMNEDLLDEVFDPLQPEALLYAPGPGGNLRLVGVEYIVADVGQPHPTFGDRPLDVGGTPMPFPHYSLHVWLYEDNPLGLFFPFNPNVSCPAH